MTPVWGAHLNCFSRLAEVTGSVPEPARARPGGNALAGAFPVVHQNRMGLARELQLELYFAIMVQSGALQLRYQ